MSQSATPATWKEGGCRQVPGLPRKVPRRHRRPIQSKRATRAGPVPKVLHLPRKTKVDVAKWHTCHVKRRQMSPKTTPATQSATGNENKCHEVPRLPRETKADVARCHACHANCREVTRDQSSPSTPPEPAQCLKCHACHAKRRWMSPSAMPAT